MTNTLKETMNEVLSSIYSDNRVNTKEYTDLEALEELKSAIECLIQKRVNKFSHI